MSFRTKVIIGAVLGLIVLCGGLGIFFANNFRSTTMAMQQEAVGEGEYILETLGRSWSMEALLDVASADFLSAVPEEKEKKDWLAKMKAELGTYKSGKALSSPVVVVKGADGKDALGSIFTTDAEFEKKDAKVQIQLIQREKGGWQMASFDVTPVKPSAN